MPDIEEELPLGEHAAKSRDTSFSEEDTSRKNTTRSGKNKGRSSSNELVKLFEIQIINQSPNSNRQVTRTLFLKKLNFVEKKSILF